jgi:hypothetical protein
MTDSLTPILNVIPPVVGTALAIEVMDKLLPSDKKACERCQRKMKEVI